MRYIITRQWPTGEMRHVMKTEPEISWTKFIHEAERMDINKTSHTSKKLMEAGMSHTIMQWNEKSLNI